MMRSLKLQLPSLSGASRPPFRVSHHDSSRLSSSEFLRPSSTTRSASCSPASARTGIRPSDASSPSSRTTNCDPKAMIRMLSVCTGWNLVRRSSHSSHGGPQCCSRNGAREERRGAVRSGGEKERAICFVEEDIEAQESTTCAAGEKSSIDKKLSGSSEKQWDDEIPAEDAQFLASIRTRYNFVRVLEIAKTADHPMAGARVLLLDKFGNVHSLYHEYRLLTDSYYDVLTSLPAIIPDGPIGIFGLGAGTAARLIHHFWPQIDMYGWELDPAVVYVARKYFNLEELEWSPASDGVEQEVLELDSTSSTRREGFVGPEGYRKWRRSANYSVFMENARVSHRRKGRLRVVVGDALGRDAAVEGGFAGIVVDLFAEGAVIPALQEPGVWREMRKKLRPGGRIMVNCGGSCVDAGVGSKDGRVTMEETIACIAREFPQQLSILPLRCRGDNHIVLTGPLPDLPSWCQALPECLRIGCEDWVTFDSRQKLRATEGHSSQQNYPGTSPSAP